MNLNELYKRGNDYIEENKDWIDMAKSNDVIVSCSNGNCKCYLQEEDGNGGRGGIGGFGWLLITLLIITIVIGVGSPRLSREMAHQFCRQYGKKGNANTTHSSHREWRQLREEEED